MSMNIDGFFDNLEKLLDELQSQVDEIASNKFVEFSDLFTDEFMRHNTKFLSIQEFFDKSPFEIKDQEDFDNIDQEKLDDFTKENSSFDSYHEMLKQAGINYIKNEL